MSQVRKSELGTVPSLADFGKNVPSLSQACPKYAKSEKNTVI